MLFCGWWGWGLRELWRLRKTSQAQLPATGRESAGRHDENYNFVERMFTGAVRYVPPPTAPAPLHPLPPSTPLTGDGLSHIEDGRCREAGPRIMAPNWPWTLVSYCEITWPLFSWRISWILQKSRGLWRGGCLTFIVIRCITSVVKHPRQRPLPWYLWIN